MLNWTPGPHAGHYVADLPDGDPSGVTCYRIARVGDRAWSITSFNGLERIRHGNAYTLREAKEIAGNFYIQRLAQVVTV